MPAPAVTAAVRPTASHRPKAMRAAISTPATAASPQAIDHSAISSRCGTSMNTRTTMFTTKTARIPAQNSAKERRVHTTAASGRSTRTCATAAMSRSGFLSRRDTTDGAAEPEHAQQQVAQQGADHVEHHVVDVGGAVADEELRRHAVYAKPRSVPYGGLSGVYSGTRERPTASLSAHASAFQGAALELTS